MPIAMRELAADLPAEVQATTEGFARHVSSLQQKSLDAGIPYPVATERHDVAWIHPDGSLRDGMGPTARVLD